MCGIAGILEFGRETRANAAALREMCRVISHRGPDDDGFYTDGAVGIGMRRLSIVDVAGRHQPISNEDGTLWIVFKGEIYNHLAFREQLITRGHLGIKPQYYKLTPERLLFGSEIKALLAHGGIRPEFNRAVLPEYLAFGYLSG